MKTKILGIIEVSLFFVLTIYLFRALQSNPPAAKINTSFNGFLFSEYTVFLVISILLYYFRGRTQTKMPWSEKMGYQGEIIALGFFPFFMLSALLTWTDWTQWTGAIMISLIEIGLLIWFAWMVRHKQPAWHKTSAISGLLLFPIVFQISNNPGGVFLAIIYFYFFVALSEEILFRGYIQSRLNSIFGRPQNFFGIRWGWGLIISSILFGFWHAHWFSGTLAWPHVLWTMFAGLMFGLVREKSESIIAPAILHGIMNYGPQAILFYLFFST